MDRLRIRVERVFGKAAGPSAAQADFQAPGGTIGRAPTCTLCLPDEARHISREQARVDYGPQGPTLTCTSSANPVLVDGRDLPTGQASPLRPGQVIQIAQFELSVQAVGMAATNPGGPAFTAPAPGPAPAAGGALIPDDFDPFSMPDESPAPAPAMPDDHPMAAPPAVSSGGPLLPADFDANASDDDIDHLLAPRPPAGPVPAPARAPAPEGLDPLARFQGESQMPESDPMPGDRDRLTDTFRLPGRIPATDFGVGAPAIPAQAPSPPASAPPAAGGPVLSWEATRDAFVPAAADSAPARVPPAQPPPARVAPPAQAQAPRVQLPGRDEGAAGSRELLDALLQGAGLARDDAGGQALPATLTPALARQVGQLLRLSVEGLVGLLQARATVKQEVRAAMTVIGSQANNPLKFSPNAQAALRQLLSGQALPGFLGPEQALRDASEDLIAHQVATMAGMRAAIDALLGRFDPAGLQARLGDASLLDAVLPLNRKGKLWESFTQLYAEISDEARQDFEKVFGEAFVAAYEAQIAALRHPPRP